MRRPRRLSRLQRYLLARMHRRIFMSFGATILLTTFVTFAVMHLTGGESQWRRDWDGARAFAAHRFAEVWHSPESRRALASSMAEDLHANLRVTDARGAVLDAFGPGCSHPTLLPIERGGEPLGTVAICVQHRPDGARVVIGLFVAFATMWAASGAIARRLARPLGELAKVAEDIGRGRLSSRVQIPRRHQHGEVKVLADVINDMAARIEKQLADQRALLATVSHEIRTPLARMRLLVEFARDGTRASQTLDEIDREVVEIDTLVSDLLASSRIDFTAVARTRLDATQVAEQAMDRAGVDASRLVVETPRLAFDGDPTLASRAVANLIENASRHGGGVETLRVFQRADCVVFEVEDAGPGFAKGDEARAFEPFYRRPNGPDAEAKSVGLGLSLVKRIAEAHGGRAYAENREGGGARVGIELLLAT